MKLSKWFVLAVVIFNSFRLANAAELAGKWTSDFDSQIGPQKYSYEFKSDGDNFTGKASYDHSMGKGDSMLKEIKLAGEMVSFVETVHLNDTDLVITYTGKISADEMKLTRVVGDYGTEEIVAKRAKPEAKKTVPAK